MRVTKRDLIIFLIIFSIGTILGTIGTVSFPIGTNMSYFWPAAVVQTVGGLFFGIWGVLAGTLFPSLSNALTDGSKSHVIWLIPANFIQSFIPLCVKKVIGFSPRSLDMKSIFGFIVGCAILPHVFGGFVGCGALFLLGDIPNQAEFWRTLRVWLIGNIPCSIVFGLLLVKTVAPILEDCNLLYKSFLK
ncbi:MAG: hypothetical protein V2A66_09365 [Pseudomonadota bacterium]